jgi:hypothetical protein
MSHYTFVNSLNKTAVQKRRRSTDVIKYCQRKTKMVKKIRIKFEIFKVPGLPNLIDEPHFRISCSISIGMAILAVVLAILVYFVNPYL